MVDKLARRDTMESMNKYGIGQWQPGETAPKDGTVVLLMFSDAIFSKHDTGLSIHSMRWNGDTELWETACFNEKPNDKYTSWCWAGDHPVQWAPIVEVEK